MEQDSDEFYDDDHHHHHHQVRRNTLPPHVSALLYSNISKSDHKLESDTRNKLAQGSYNYSEIQKSLAKPAKKEPWLKSKEEKEDQRSRASITRISLHQSKGTISRISISPLSQASKTQSADEGVKKVSKIKTEIEKLRDFDKLIDQSPNKKIAFIPLPYDNRSMPAYVTTRLETASRSARYELPMNIVRLEKLTPLEYICTHTRLYKEQRIRYEKIFKRFKHRYNDIIEGIMLYPALNSMFGGFFSKHNYNILMTALFMDETSPLDINTFVSICTFCDRLYWTTYLDGSNTFNFWAPNRSAIEVLDFANLHWKLHGVNVSKELRQFLFSLA